MNRRQSEPAAVSERHATAATMHGSVGFAPDGAQARGSALIPVTLVVFLVSAIAVGAAVVIRVEVAVAERFRESTEAFYAAQAALDVAMSELRRLPEWTSVVGGGAYSPLSQGAFLGAKAVPGGGTVDVCCSAGSAFDRLMTASRTSPHPARRALAWHPYLWTTFDALAPRDPPTRLYVIVFAAEDEEDAVQAGDGDTNGIVLLRADAIAPGGLHRTIEMVVARRPPDVHAEGEASGSEPAAVAPPPPLPVGVLSWREVR